MRPVVQSLGRAFRKWPIERKLLAIIMATTTLALALAAAGIRTSDSILFRQYLERDLTALSQIIADNSTGALAFDDAKVAAETLGALRARPHLIAACVYRRDGSVLARYFRGTTELPCPPGVDHIQMSYTPGGIVVSRPVTLTGRPIGTLTLLYDLGEFRERMLLFGGTVIGILLVSSILAFLLSSRLRRLLTVPISRLVSTATSVSTSRDYSIRAEKLTSDEMGVLVDAFNDMLARIESRDEELRQSLLAREQTNRELVRSNEDLEGFAFVASHDLQEPLRMISVYTQLLQKRSLIDASAQTAEFVQNIVSGARRMRELLDDLRAYAELGTPGDPAGAVDLNVVLEKAKENLAFSIQTSRAVVTSVQMPCVSAYEGHLIPLFQNLIGNAIKYRGKQPPQVCVTYRRNGNGELLFEVSDNGIGIAPEYHWKVFIPFKRLHGPDIPGSGIGLAICKRVVERYGGSIWVQSNLGEGSKFMFTLPDKLLVTTPGTVDDPNESPK